MPTVGVTAAVQGGVQRHLKQFDDGAWCQCSQFFVDAADCRPDNRAIGNGAANVGWPSWLGAGAGASRGALENKARRLQTAGTDNRANGVSGGTSPG